MLAALGHLAVWAGLYVAAAVACAAQLADAPGALRPGPLFFAWSTAVFAYLLDRVKLRDAWLDPADPVAHPHRYAFLHRHLGAVRLLMLLMAGASAASAVMIHPYGWIATPLVAAGVLIYAGFPRRRRGDNGIGAAPPRPKDIFLLKNAFVGAGIGAFALLVVAAAQAGPGRLAEWAVERPLLLALVLSHLVVRVFADAVLCDIDDEPADRRHDTHTLPTRVGRQRAWTVAMVVRLALAASLLVWPVGPWRTRMVWAIVTGLTTVGLRLANPRAIRDLVDVRFAAEAAGVWVALSLTA